MRRSWQVNNCAIRKVDPYLRVPQLTTSLEGNAQATAVRPCRSLGAHACILKTVYHRSNNKPT